MRHSASSHFFFIYLYKKAKRIYLKSVAKTDLSFTEDFLTNKEKMYIALSELTYRRNVFPIEYEEVRWNNGVVTHIPKMQTREHAQINCTFSLSANLALNPETIYHQKEPKQRKRKKYEEMEKCLLQGKIPDKTLVETAKKMINSIGVVGIRKGNEYTFFEANQRGTSRYSIKTYWNIHDAAKILAKNYKHSYFLTLTQAHNKSGDNMIKLGKEFQKGLKRICQYINRMYDGDSIVIIEPHKTGHLHAHIQFFTNKEDRNVKLGYNRKSKCKYVRSSEIKRYINKHWTIGFNQWQVIDDNRVVNYLTKYVSKNTQKDFKNILKKQRITDSDRKVLLSLVLPAVQGFRSVRLPKNIHEQENVAETTEENSVAVEEQLPKRHFTDWVERLCRMSPRARRAYLIALCTKSTPLCGGFVRFGSLRQVESFCAGKMENIDKLKPEKRKKIYRNMNTCGCNGCIFSEMLHSIIAGEVLI